MLSRGRVVDWATAIVVAIGVVASIPMIPILLIGWLVLSARSPIGGFGTFRTTRTAARDAAPGRLEGFDGALLFPMVVAGWFLIALAALGLTIGDTARPDRANATLGLLLFLGLLVGPTLLAYRSMHPEIAGVPFTEWLGSRGYGRVGVPLVTWIACLWLAWSITTWTTFVGATWTSFCTAVLVCLAIVLPGAFLLIRPVGGPRLYVFIGVATVVGLISVAAYLAALTPSPRWP